MIIQPKDREEAINIVGGVTIQGDPRYNDFYSEVILSDFLVSRAISLEEKEIPSMDKPKEEDMKEMSMEVQRIEKYIAKRLLKQLGFKNEEIIFERSFYGSRPDVYAESNNKIILVECRSCRVNKIIEYLSEENTEVWIITGGDPPWGNPLWFQKTKWFIFRRGQNWDKIYKEHQRELHEELRKIKSPIDTLYENKEDLN